MYSCANIPLTAIKICFRKIEGVATLGSLKAKVLKGKVMPTDAVDKAAYHTFKKVTLDTSLEKLDRILDKEHFALVVHSQRLCKYKLRFTQNRIKYEIIRFIINFIMQ